MSELPYEELARASDIDHAACSVVRERSDWSMSRHLTGRRKPFAELNRCTCRLGRLMPGVGGLAADQHSLGADQGLASHRRPLLPPFLRLHG